MPPSPPSRSPHVPVLESVDDDAVRALLRDLGPRLRRGNEDAVAREASGRRLPTGLQRLDQLIAGGFPAGRLSEIHGPLSSGRTSVALGLLAQATREGEVAAVVDPGRAFDPASAQAAGANLERLLWVQPRDVRETSRCCQLILEARGFALVLCDLAAPETLPGKKAQGGALPTSVWQKLARAAPGSGTALVVLSDRRTTGSHGDLVIEMQPARAHFSGTPALLEGLEVEAVVVRHRTGPDQRAASVRLDARTRGAA